MIVQTLEQRFAKWACNRLTEDADFRKKKKIKFSNESHFDLGGYVNKGMESSHEYIKKCCGFWSRGIIGSFFYENEQGEVVIVNRDRYRAMLNEFMSTKIEEDDIGNISFQQDSATCHTAEATLVVLRPVFEKRIINRRVDVVWSPRSCELTPLDYNLRGAVKDKCYANKSETIDALKDNIR